MKLIVLVCPTCEREYVVHERTLAVMGARYVFRCNVERHGALVYPQPTRLLGGALWVMPG